MPEPMVLKRPALGYQPEHAQTWNPQRYYVDYLLLGLGFSLVTYLAAIRFGGDQAAEVWVMLTSQVHFMISYAFHYAVLRRTLTTPTKQLAFGYTFFPMVILFPMIYYSSWFPRSLASYLMMVYFAVHLVRDEHALYVQRSSGLRRFALDKTLQAHAIFTILALAVLLFGNYAAASSASLEGEDSIFREAPAWIFQGLLLVVFGWGIATACLTRGEELRARGRGVLYSLGVACAILLFNRWLTPRISTSAFNQLLIYYHNIVWYIVGVDRVLHAARAVQLPAASVTATRPLDPFGKFKKSLPHFLGLVLGMNLLFGGLHALSRLEPFQSLEILFRMKYMALWAFPHITMHLYPKK